MNSVPPSSAAIPFQRPDRWLSDLDAEVVAQMVGASSDVALILDDAGVIRDIAVGSGDLAARGLDGWVGRAWVDTVTADSRNKVVEIIRDVAQGVPARWRELNQTADDGDELPVRCYALAAGKAGQIVVLGRDLQATAALQQRLMHVQQSVERDYLRLRQAESRYRLLFQGASEAVLILDASTRRVREANPAASALLGQAEGALEGQPFAALLSNTSVETGLAMLAGASGGSPSATSEIELVNGLVAQMSTSLFRQDRATSLLVRLRTAGPREIAEDPNARLNAVLDGIPDAFVVTSPDLRILAVNPAFLDLTHLATREEALGQPLERYLGRPQIDMKVLLGQLREHGSVRNFATLLRGRFGEPEQIEVSAVSVAGDPPCLGFTIRGVARRLTTGAASDVEILPAARSVSQLTQLIGRAPMKEIVRESTDVIERLCIEAALKMTSNNRAAAADMLGLSRQSLYSKLNRFGLGGGDDKA